MTTKGYRGTREQWALLALLLDADGAVVPYAVLGDLIGANGVNDSKAIRQYVRRFERRGIRCVAVVPGRGCRMVGLPPDDVLDDVLTMLDVIRRAGYTQPAALGRTG